MGDFLYNLAFGCWGAVVDRVETIDGSNPGLGDSLSPDASWPGGLDYCNKNNIPEAKRPKHLQRK